MPDEKEATVLITQEACDYLRVSKPTYVKYLLTGRIKGIKAGKGWRVLKTELDRFLKGDNGDESLSSATTEDYTENAVQGGN